MLADRLRMSPTIPVDIQFTDSDVSGTITDEYTFAGKDIGAVASDRVIAVGVGTSSGTNAAVISSVTIGGISATKAISSNAEENSLSDIWYATVPTGTTATVVVTYTLEQQRCGIGVWAVYNSSGAPTATAEDNQDIADASAVTSTTINVPANGGVLAYACGVSGGVLTFTLAGVTEDFDENIASIVYHTGGAENYASAQVGLTVSCTATANTRQTMPVAAWGP